MHQARPFLLLICLLALAGCASQASDDLVAQPSIPGEWSEPVNGIRMAVKRITDHTPANEITLLILTQNISDQPVDWPGIHPQHAVARAQDGIIQPSIGSGNLRVAVESLDRPSQCHDYAFIADELAQLHLPILPGEIRLHAIQLRDAELQQMREMLQSADEIPMDRVVWPGMSEPSSKGRWRIRLSYRPDGDFPKPEGTEQLSLVIEPDSGWAGLQIDLIPLEFDWIPARYSRFSCP